MSGGRSSQHSELTAVLYLLYDLDPDALHLGPLTVDQAVDRIEFLTAHYPNLVETVTNWTKTLPDEDRLVAEGILEDLSAFIGAMRARWVDSAPGDALSELWRAVYLKARVLAERLGDVLGPDRPTL